MDKSDIINHIESLDMKIDDIIGSLHNLQTEIKEIKEDVELMK